MSSFSYFFSPPSSFFIKFSQSFAGNNEAFGNGDLLGEVIALFFSFSVLALSSVISTSTLAA